MSKDLTAWNKHQGVGATLVDNWVEERATEKYILEERNDGKFINTHGHKNIMSYPELRELPSTTFRESFKPKIVDERITKTEGKLRQLLERKWVEKIMDEIAAEDKQEELPNQFISTHQEHFGHLDIYPNLEVLGKEKPSDEMLAKYEHAITFWTDMAARKNGHTICSIDNEEFEHLVKSNAIKFGRHTLFSTPVDECTKVLQKE